MSKTRSKSPAEKASEKALRKNKSVRRKLGLDIGDRVRIIDIPSHLKDPGYDLHSAEHKEMRTAELFRFCLGREFTIYGFDRYGYVEFEPSKSPTILKKFGMCTIWVEPEFLKLVRKGRAREKR